MKRAHVFIEGQVQGVGFRQFTKSNAREIGVSGWVKNLPDGRVEAVFEGDENRLNKMIDLVRQGPRSGKVAGVDVEWETPPEELNGFKVKYF